MDTYLHYQSYKLLQEQLHERERRYQPRRESRWDGTWRRMLARPRAFFELHIAGRRRVAPLPPLPEFASEEEWLTQSGFSPDQIVLFQRLRQWYAMCNREQGECSRIGNSSSGWSRAAGWNREGMPSTEFVTLRASSVCNEVSLTGLECSPGKGESNGRKQRCVRLHRNI